MPDDFIELYKNVERALYITALYYLKNSSDAEDAVQETVISAYRSYHKTREKQFFKTWITRILINKCKDAIRHRKRHPSCELTDDLEAFSELCGDELWIKDSISKLPDADRELIVLRFFNDLTYNETARVLRKPISTVKFQTQKAMTQLEYLLKGGK